MDVVERLTLEAAQADTMLACEHRQRYELAAELVEGMQVIDLCCGSGYGSAILARSAAGVVGVDVDVATIESARATLGAGAAGAISFEAEDAVAYLERLPSTADALVCFEGLEHLEDLSGALALLRRHAQRGLRIVASVPNDQLFEATNPYHVTSFGYDEALAAFSGFDQVVMVPQFLAEGSLLLPEGARETDVSLSLEDRLEPEYANHFIFCVNFDPEHVARAHRGRIQLNTSPVFNRWSEDLKRGAWALRRENARLARARLGKGGAAAASLLARLEAQSRQAGALVARAEAAEARVAELEAQLARAAGPGTAEEVSPDVVPVAGADGVGSTVEVFDPRPPELGPGEHPNSWERRLIRARDVLIPWIEQTVPLAGRTVLEYGCGYGSVSAAFAERAGRVIGVDIDAEAVAEGRRRLGELGVANAELSHHPLAGILDAVRAHRGEVDVFLLYAVLEHLTLDERLAVLELARDVVRPGGAIVVCETPNRLVYLDHHTAQMPFFHLLPDELAARVYPRSLRPDFTAALAAAEAEGPAALAEAVVRWGRGVSYHEFEVVFGDLSRHVLASSYDPLLFSERPIHPEEVVLARYLDRVRPDLAPAWSRQWLDVILSPVEVERRGPFLRPWTAQTVASRDVGWTAWENLRLRNPEAVLWVELPRPTRHILLGSVADGRDALVLEVSAPEQAVLLAELRVPPPHTGFASFRFPRPVQRLAVRASSACHLVFVGFED